MKKIILGLSAITLLFACEAETKVDDNITENLKNDTQTTTEDSVVSETPAKVVEMTFADMKFEDYGDFENRGKLIAFFGEENIKNGVSFYGEGTMQYAHSIVTNPKTGHVVKVLWQEKDSNKINFIEANYNIYDNEYNLKGNQIIPSKSGLSLGMKLKDLVAWNEGNEIKFSGFAWDFHGGVHPAEGSKIMNSGLSLTMDFSDPTGIPTEFLGDVTLSSKDQKVMDAPIVIGTLTKYYHNEE